jgi:hypothetical protein
MGIRGSKIKASAGAFFVVLLSAKMAGCISNADLPLEWINPARP